jgi:hypothetical protein
VSVPVLSDALRALWLHQRAARRAYENAMEPARTALAKAKATGDARHTFNVYHRDVEPVWFAADVALRAARDDADQAFRRATGLEPWERFSDEPFGPATSAGPPRHQIAPNHTRMEQRP